MKTDYTLTAHHMDTRKTNILLLAGTSQTFRVEFQEWYIFQNFSKLSRTKPFQGLEILSFKFKDFPVSVGTLFISWISFPMSDQHFQSI